MNSFIKTKSSARLLLICLLFFASQANAQQHSTTMEHILKLEQRWVNALIAVDLDAVDNLMHRDFRLIRTYSDGPPISKEMYLGMKGMKVNAAEVTSIQIAEDTGTVVVARTKWTLDWQQEGIGKLPPNFDMIDTWVKDKDGKWRILSRVSLLVN